MRDASPGSSPVLSRAELLALGYTGRGITSAVRTGALRRLRRDHYVQAGPDKNADIAVRIGGRLACVRLLETPGVLLPDRARLPCNLPPPVSRLRRPAPRSTPPAPRAPRGA